MLNSKQVAVIKMATKGTAAKRYVIPGASYLEMAQFQGPLPQG